MAKRGAFKVITIEIHIIGICRFSKRVYDGTEISPFGKKAGVDFILRERMVALYTVGNGNGSIHLERG